MHNSAPSMESNYKITSGSVTDRGLSEKRPQNEDSLLELPHLGVFAVADGVGGAQAGEVASQMAVELIGEAFANRHPEQDPEAVMRIAISQANSAIYQMAQELPQLSNMATTIVALHINEDVATIGHVGDSRLYRVDREGNLFADTEDHSMVADEVRAGRMTPEQAENHPGRNIINRALGAESSVTIDLKTILIEPGTSFLLCSDGITRHVTDAEIKGVLTFGGPPQEVCEYLKGLCYERGAEDNLTAVVVRVSAHHGLHLVETPSTQTEDDEATVSSVRASGFIPADDDDNEVLELDTLELERPQPVVLQEESEPEPPVASPEIEEPAATEDRIDPVAIETANESRTTESAPSYGSDTFSMFGAAGDNVVEESPSSGSSRVLMALAMLVLGSLIGLGVYHFALAPKPAAPAPDEKLSVMQAEDIAFSSYEKLRRTVDSDPAAYIKEVPPADDAEDYYLIGRAYLLTGDFPKARQAFIEAQKQLAATPTSNAKVLHTDIVTGLMITNDTTLQPRFKQELDSTIKMASNTATANSNR